ncbi:MAG: hypothetical protein KGD63_03260 [Candidatus Lokiarchaeota archaeon]|nr:hypothetical protein [Candidatus Lokiarchaeota archaeon]
MAFFFIGHRGTRKVFDENTIKSFDIAIKSGADYIEFDVRRTKDNQFIIFHDPSLDRTTNGSGTVDTFTYNELSKFRTKKNNQKILLINEILDRYRDKTKFMIELKEEGIQDDILDLIKKKDLINKCIISGRNIYDLLSIKNKNPECLVCYNITKGKDLTLKSFLENEEFNKLEFPIDMLSLRSNQITKKFINICHMNNILAFSWDFMEYENSLEKIKNLIKMGIDGLLFDDFKNISHIKSWKYNLDYN